MQAYHLNTPRIAYNQAQQSVWQWVSDGFGNQQPSGSITVNLRFPGQYYDSETQMHYNWHRYYNPQSGRYLTSDPIGLAGGLNTYGYVGGNPLMYTDRFGLLCPGCDSALDIKVYYENLYDGIAGTPDDAIKHAQGARDLAELYDSVPRAHGILQNSEFWALVIRPIKDLIWGDPTVGGKWGSRELQSRMDYLNNIEGLKAYREGRPIDPTDLYIYNSTFDSLVKNSGFCEAN